LPEQFNVALLESGLEFEQPLVLADTQPTEKAISITMGTEAPIKIDIFIDYT
jgi:hypothetical protein